MRKSKKEKLLAKCKDFDVGFEDHGFPILLGTFRYENGSAQGLGYSITIPFLEKFLGVFNVTRLAAVNNKKCWVTCDQSHIYKIEPFNKKRGETFNITKFIEEQDNDNTR